MPRESRLPTSWPAGRGAKTRAPLPSAEEIAKLPEDGGDEFNRLVFSKSPYLLQHARNPVDWHEWGPEAFALANPGDLATRMRLGALHFRDENWAVSEEHFRAALAGLTARELVLHLSLHGARTVERLSRELQLDPKVLDGYVSALVSKGAVTLGRTNRGSTVVRLSDETQLLDFSKLEECA